MDTGMDTMQAAVIIQDTIPHMIMGTATITAHAATVLEVLTGATLQALLPAAKDLLGTMIST
jgi:hypothetical protein